MEKLLSHKLIISCEHSSNQIPKGFEYLFEKRSDILKTHRGWDPGALELANEISKKLNAPLFTYPWTRLLIEPNRSVGHKQLYSEFSSTLPDKEKLIQKFYLPYRNRIKKRIEEEIKMKNRVIHLSVHTFTPVLDDQIRNFDIGLLYDPGRKPEKELSAAWKKKLNKDFRVRLNQPYKGTADGFTTHMRKKFGEKSYSGIELEVNQKMYFAGADSWKKACELIAESIKNTFNSTDL
jgi:predicted N-formylglutamate amidohydrolase